MLTQRRTAVAAATALPAALLLTLASPLAAHAAASYTVVSGVDSAGLPTLTYTFTGNPDSEYVGLRDEVDPQLFRYLLEFDTPYTWGCVEGIWTQLEAQIPTPFIDLLEIDPNTFDLVLTERIRLDNDLCVPAVDVPDEEEPVVDDPDEEEPVIDNPDNEEPIIDNPGEEEPVVDNPGQEEPVIDSPVEEEPVIDNPGEEEPQPEVPVEQPLVDNPDSEGPDVVVPVKEQPAPQTPEIVSPAAAQPAANAPAAPVRSLAATGAADPLLVGGLALGAFALGALTLTSRRLFSTQR